MSLMVRNSTERLGGEYDLKPKGFDFFLYAESTQPFQASTSVVLCWFQKGVVFLLKCTAVHYPTVSFLANCALVTRTNRVVVFERNFHLLNPRIAPLPTASARSGRVVSENSRIALIICSERWNWVGYCRTARPLDSFRLNKIVMRVLQKKLSLGSEMARV